MTRSRKGYLTSGGQMKFYNKNNITNKTKNKIPERIIFRLRELVIEPP